MPSSENHLSTPEMRWLDIHICSVADVGSQHELSECNMKKKKKTDDQITGVVKSSSNIIDKSAFLPKKLPDL